MDNFFKNIQEKLSGNLVVMMIDAKIGQHIKQDDVKKTLEKLDPKQQPTEELANKPNTTTENTAQSKPQFEDNNLVNISDEPTKVEPSKPGYNILKKSSHRMKMEPKEVSEPVDDLDDDIDPVWDI